MSSLKTRLTLTGFLLACRRLRLVCVFTGVEAAVKCLEDAKNKRARVRKGHMISVNYTPGYEKTSPANNNTPAEELARVSLNRKKWKQWR